MNSGSGRLAGLSCALVSLAVSLALMSQPPAVAAPAAALGPEIAVGEPANGYVGRLDVSPEHAPAGTPVTAHRRGPAARPGIPAGLDHRHRGVEGHRRRVPRPRIHAGRLRDRQGQNRPSGRLAVTFIAPDDYGFMHDIVLQQGSRLFTQVAFNLDMTVEISPKSGPPGTPIKVDVKGIGYRSLYNSWDVIYDNNFTGWISSVTTKGSASFTIPATGGPGVHIIEVMHGELTFPYRNPEQNPAPGRPRFEMAFTVTDGAPVLPPPPEQQAQKIVRVLPPQGELVATPPFTGVGEPALVRGDGLEPGKSYQLNWTRVVGNRMMGPGAEQPGRTNLGGIVQGDRREQG